MKVMDKIIFDAEVSERKILRVPVNTIIATPYNPRERTDDGKKLRKLAETVKQYGIIQPIIITADRDLVDGNRRLAAAKLAGQTHIDCIILAPEVDKDVVFGDLNTTSEKIGNRGWLYVCRHGMRTPPEAIRAAYQELFKLVGTYGIDLMIERKLGLGLLDQCKSIKAQGVVMRLDEIIIRTAKRKLTNKLNVVLRDKVLTQSEKAAALTEILEDDGK